VGSCAIQKQLASPTGSNASPQKPPGGRSLSRYVRAGPVGTKVSARRAQRRPARRPWQ
jgi:hypothetical protein